MCGLVSVTSFLPVRSPYCISGVLVCVWVMDERTFWITRAGIVTDLAETAKGDINVTIPYWIYQRICNLLAAVGSGAKPEDYIVAVLEGHVRRLNM